MTEALPDKEREDHSEIARKFRKLGFTTREADLLAAAISSPEQAKVMLWKAEQWLGQGCVPSVAFRILI